MVGVGALIVRIQREEFLAAHRFYERNGFQRISDAELPPAFPKMAVDSIVTRSSFEHAEALKGSSIQMTINLRL